MAVYRESLVFNIATDPPALFWSGFGALPLAADAVIPAASLALGAGELVSIPDFEALINGTAQRMDFVLSGVSEETIRLAREDALEVPGARVDIGRIDFGPDWQPLGPVEWEWTGEARSLSVSSQASDSGRTRTITLTVAAGSTTRSRAPIAFFTDADQRRRPGSSSDSVFNYVAGINGGTSRRWGPAT